MRDAHRLVQDSPYRSTPRRIARQRLALSAMVGLLVACAWVQLSRTHPIPEKKELLASVVPPQVREAPPWRAPTALAQTPSHAVAPPPKALVVPRGAQKREPSLHPKKLGRSQPVRPTPFAEGPPGPGEYTLQLSAYAHPAEAQALCAQLTRKGYAPYIAASKTGAWHRVRMGRFADARAAQMAQKVLATGDLPAWVVRP